MAGAFQAITDIYEALKLKVDENGNVTPRYRELALDLGWTIKGKKPNVSRVKRVATKGWPADLPANADRNEGEADGLCIPHRDW